jgi:hypothetical protein
MSRVHRHLTVCHSDVYGPAAQLHTLYVFVRQWQPTERTLG